MNYLTMEEKVYLIKGFFSREKVYVNAYRAFRTRCGTHRVANESTLKKLEKFIYSYSCTALRFSKIILILIVNRLKFTYNSLNRLSLGKVTNSYCRKILPFCKEKKSDKKLSFYTRRSDGPPYKEDLVIIQ
ncbi:hypothetical protein DMN91_007956 [Ooceraea biroi]|uniref:DUF4817 domain-containing protein n=1 Tax=Ooceraea biroi TaxID=2015173 RepID=A0A3L8DHK8_OOCBI|nr:hypothetical protein DMN91_007956 [Ooceraea biroi]